MATLLRPAQAVRSVHYLSLTRVLALLMLL